MGCRRVDVREYKRIGALYPDAAWKAGMAKIEYDRGHLHHGILWAENNPEIFFVPFAWAALGDQDKLRESYNTLRRQGGSFADLMDVEEMFLTHDYSGVAAWFEDPEKIVNFLRNFQLFHPWVADVYLRDWPGAEKRLEVFLAEFPTEREIFWGSPAGQEFIMDMQLHARVGFAVAGIYVAAPE